MLAETINLIETWEYQELHVHERSNTTATERILVNLMHESDSTSIVSYALLSLINREIVVLNMAGLYMIIGCLLGPRDMTL